MDYDFVRTMELQLRVGRDFSRQYATDSTEAVLINETLARQLGVKEAVGTLLPIQDGQKPWRVIMLIILLPLQHQPFPFMVGS